MNKEQEQMINDKIKVYEAIKLLNDTDYNLIKEEINLNINLSKNQYKSLNRKINMLKAVSLFLKKKCYVKDVALELNLGTTCIKKYLNDPSIEKELGIEIKEEIKQKLLSNLNEGRKRGSENYVLFNEAIKLQNGRFNGSIKRM